MSISLKNHEDRIKELESRSGTSLTSNSGWADFTNGLQMRWGYVDIKGRAEEWQNYNFAKPFSSAASVIVSGYDPYNDNILSNEILNIKIVDKNSFAFSKNYQGDGDWTDIARCYYMAIGY